MAFKAAAVKLVTTQPAAKLFAAPHSITTLRAAANCAPGELLSLHLEHSDDLVCRNLMCDKVGGPCVCRLGRWMNQNRDVLASCQHLSLRGNNLSVLPDEVWNLPRLTHLDVSQNKLSEIGSGGGGYAAAGFGDWEYPSEITTPTSDDGAGGIGIGRLNELEVLYVNDNDLASLPREIFALPKLRYVNVSGNGALVGRQDLSETVTTE